MQNSTETIQDFKISTIIAPSASYKNEYNLMITYNNIIYTSKIHESLFESKFYGWDMFETLILNGIINEKVGDIECLTECSVNKEQKILTVSLTLKLDKKPMKTILEKFDFKLVEKLLEFDDKINIALSNLKNELNQSILGSQSVINQYHINNDTINIYKDNTCIWTINPISSGLTIRYLNKFLLFMPFLKTKAEFNNLITIKTSKYYSRISSSEYNYDYDGIDCQFLIDNFILEADKNMFFNYKTDFETYSKLCKYLESIKLFKLTNSSVPLEITYITVDKHYINRCFANILLNITDTNINHIKLFNDKLVLFTNPTKTPFKRKLKIYKDLDEFDKARDIFKTYHILEYDENKVIVEELPN
jgi:hypothetical protein